MSDPASPPQIPPPAAPPERSARFEPITLDGLIRAGFLGLFVWLSLSMLAPFGILALWSVILAVAVAPLHGWLAARLGGRERLAAGLVTLVLLGLLIGPMAVLVADLTRTLETLAAGLHGGSAATPAGGTGAARAAHGPARDRSGARRSLDAGHDRSGRSGPAICRQAGRGGYRAPATSPSNSRWGSESSGWR